MNLVALFFKRVAPFFYLVAPLFFNAF